MARQFLLDTDVMVDFLRGQPEAVSFVKSHADNILLSAIVVAELYAGVREGKEREILDNLLTVFRVLPISAEVASMGGIYKRDWGKSHGISLADAIIAVTAEQAGAELKTLNVKHYPMFTGLKPAYQKK